MKLAPNFTREEFTRSREAAKAGLPNDLPKNLLENAKRLAAEVLQPLRDAINGDADTPWGSSTDKPVVITSGYRNDAVNRLVGGSRRSQHVQALAADLTVPGMTPLAVAKKIRDLDLPYDQLVHEYGQWVHVSIAAYNREPRKQLLTIDAAGRRDGLFKARK